MKLLQMKLYSAHVFERTSQQDRQSRESTAKSGTLLFRLPVDTGLQHSTIIRIGYLWPVFFMDMIGPLQKAEMLLSGKTLAFFFSFIHINMMMPQYPTIKLPPCEYKFTFYFSYMLKVSLYISQLGHECCKCQMNALFSVGKNIGSIGPVHI